MSDLHRGFQNQSDGPEARAAFRFLDLVDALPAVRAYKQRMHEHLDLEPGDVVLDAGCGVGSEAQRIAEIVGPGGRCVGLDKNRDMIEEARRRTEGRDPRASFVVGDMHRIDLESGTFSACWAERVLIYAPEPAVAVGEMVRVLRPGGRLVCFDFDYDAVVFDTPDRASTRRIVHALADALPSGLVGRQLPRLLREAGLRDVTAQAHMLSGPFDVFQRIIGGAIEQLVNAGALDRAAVDPWMRSFIERTAGDEFYAMFVGFIVSGQKPSL